MNTQIEINLRYGLLDTDDLTNLFTGLNNLYKGLLKKSNHYNSNPDTKQPFRNFLEIDTISNGQSIRIIFKEGWMEESCSEKKNNKAKFPTNLGIPVLLLNLLLKGGQKKTKREDACLNEQLDVVANKIKQLPLFKKLEKVNEYNKTFATHLMQKKADDMIESLVNNQNIHFLDINGATLKK